MTLLSLHADRAIEGYTLLERIGAGGYGEVWKAEGPGGLTKAVKYVYGRLEDQRAVCELKALERIKGVRHPFLLSLERVDVIDGQLVIVTELAEGSLKDRFEECRRSGLPGIPRDELIGLLRDAADALDYMSQHYSLQHLDVKPENLLLVGGRAKVADFGLVKDLQDLSVSLSGGLTPVYAAPEVFDGRPSLESDQYSLAVVCQEMLTGELPFPGRTPAQLAVQHASSQPRLGALEPADRATIARALAKDPHERFPSCRAMVDSLAGACRSEGGDQREPSAAASAGAHGGAAAPVASDGPGPRVPADDSMVTVALDRGGKGGGNLLPERPAINLRSVPGFAQEVPDAPSADDEPEASPGIEDLPPLEISVDQHRLRPVLVLGIGGTAARTLRRLRGRLNDRFGDVAKVPAVRMLLVDTDRKTLVDATSGDPRTSLSRQETLALPLRRPQQYRSDARRHLQWLSRRWLYNIPRSLKTGGLRPLGRLALADHVEVFLKQLQRGLAAACAPKALAASAQCAGAAAGELAPRVYVVASISGGTGSGMVLDVAALVRKALANLQLADDGLVSVLLHSTSAHPEQHDLAVANAHACLCELYHYEKAEGGRGTGEGSGAGVQGLEELSSTFCLPPSAFSSSFRHTYLVPLGEGLDDEDLDAATDAVAQYIFLNAVTPAGVFFDACRAAAPGGGGDSPQFPQLRTFGLAQVGSSQDSLPAELAQKVCRQVVARWQGADSDEGHQTARAAEQLAAKLGLELKPLIDGAYRAVRAELGRPPESYFADLLARLGGAKAPPWQLVLRTLDELLGPAGAAGDGQRAPGSLWTALGRSLGETAAKHGAAIADWILERPNCPTSGVAGARRAARWFIESIRSLESDLRQLVNPVKEKLAELEPLLAKDELRNPKPPSARLGRGQAGPQDPTGDQPWLEYCCLRLSAMVLQCVGKALRLVSQQVVAVEDRLGELSRVLGQLADQFDSESEKGVRNRFPERPATNLRSVPGLAQTVPDTFPLEDLAAEIDGRLRGDLLAGQDGIFRLLEQDGRHAELFRQLTVALRAASRAAVLKALSQLEAARLSSGPHGAGVEGAGEPDDTLEEALPALGACGGARRLLVVAPEAELARVPSACSGSACPEASVVVDPNVDLTYCYEMERVSVRRAAALVIDHRPDYAQVAARLHTRIDVHWPRLV